MNGMLSGFRVTEIGDSLSVRYCGLMFALSGAQVTRYARGIDDRELETYLDHGKRIAMEPGWLDGVYDDVFVADPDFDWSALGVAGGPCVTGTVDAFALHDDRSGWRAPEVVLAAVGGAASYTRTPGGAPVYGFGHRFEFLAGQFLFIALTSMLGGSDMDMRPAPRVRVSAAEVVSALLPYGTTQYAYNQTTTTIEQSGPRFLVECSDGFLCVYAGGPWRNLVDMLGGRAMTSDVRFVQFGQRFAHVEELEGIVQAWAADKTVADAIEAADRSSVAVAPCHRLDDVLHDTTLAANGTLIHTPVNQQGAVIPGLPMRLKGQMR